MSIIQTTNQLRDAVKSHGNYRELSKQAGVNYHWVCKFSSGEITNPTVTNIHKLEVFFKKISKQPIQNNAGGVR